MADAAGVIAGSRVLATDLDGTLLRPDHSISDRTRRSIVSAIGRGVRVVFVTGRPPRWMAAVAEATGHAGVAICANGAVVIDMATERISTSQSLPTDAIANLVDVARAELGDGARFGAEQAVPGPISDSRLLNEPGFLPKDVVTTLRHVAIEVPLERIVTEPGIVKVLVRATGPVEETEHVAAAVSRRLGDQVTVTHSSKTHQLLEVAPAGVTKATALADLVSAWGLQALDVVAVGDMPNDLPMLEWAGRGFAVTSAHPQLLAVCHSVVPDPAHDGVATILDRMLPA